MSRIEQDDAPRPGETETDRINRYERNMPGGGRVESDPDPENEEEGGLASQEPDDRKLENSGQLIKGDKGGSTGP